MRLSSRLAASAALAFLLGAPAASAQSIETMAGQMIVVGFVGDSADDKGVEAARAKIASGGLGGVMFLKTNVASKASVVAMTAAFRDAAPAGLPPFITIDQEGGAVERLTRDVGFTEIDNARTVASTLSPAAAQSLYEGLAKGVADWGFNVNFAPVVDLAVNPDNQVIARFGRAFGADADTVATYAAAVVAAHHKAGIITSLKHFPGHGSSTADSHEGFVDITRTWSDTELDPYRKLIAGGYDDMVMVGHLIDTNVDPSGLPSSLSAPWINGVLRDKLGFSGVVISDDLQMGAIRDHFDLRDTVIRAVNAGVDVLLFSNTVRPRSSLADEVRAILVEEANADPAFAARVAAAYNRIVALKARIGQRG